MEGCHVACPSLTCSCGGMQTSSLTIDDTAPVSVIGTAAAAVHVGHIKALLAALSLLILIFHLFSCWLFSFLSPSQTVR